jgi:hypothetical protein
MMIPTDRPVFEGEIATYWFDEGMLVSLSKNPRRTVENLGANGTLVKEITHNTRMPLLIYLCDSPVPHKAARRFASKQLPLLYSAMAMVSQPGLAQFIMRILFALKPPPIPMKSFLTDMEAKEWLRQYVEN